ncbi:MULTISPECIES: ABC transporter substrate-binding protein [unclassified Micromonospora]|uniref:ABC transporter substrate-binding protein n=1 Tax=unclassified Micromonospora TaxID=2617518 RepID=UPI00143DE79C|nr:MULTISPECIES: ABC transporter substrate-binding protein [unclassified Micromonospora]
MSTTSEPTVLETVTEQVRAFARTVDGAPTVTVGIVTPLSLPGDPTAGTLTARGALIGAEYVRDHGGIRDGLQFDFVVRDDQETVTLDGGTMPRSAVGALAKVAIVDRALAVLGPWHLRYTEEVADLADRIGVPLFIENAHPGVTAQKRRAVFRTFTSMAERAPVLIRFAADQGFRRVGLIHADTVFGRSAAALLTAELQAAEEPMELYSVEFDQESTTDLRPQLREIQQWGPDVVINVGVVRTNHLIVQQAAEIGLLPEVPMLAPFQWPLRAPDYWKALGAHGLHLVWPATQFSPNWSGLTPIGRWFVDRYRDTYGTMPPDTALNAFTDITIIAQALRQADRVGRAELIDALEKGTFDTWRGPVSFTRGETHWHHSPPPVVLQQYQEIDQDISTVPIVYPPELRTAGYVRPGSST